MADAARHDPDENLAHARGREVELADDERSARPLEQGRARLHAALPACPLGASASTIDAAAFWPVAIAVSVYVPPM